MNSLTFDKSFHNSKIFFSKRELNKILSCYYVGVSRGNWKDYAINVNNYEVNFLMFKHSLAAPDCVLTKTKKIKKNKFFFNLDFGNKKKNDFKRIEDLLIILRRNYLRII